MGTCQGKGEVNTNMEEEKNFAGKRKFEFSKYLSDNVYKGRQFKWYITIFLK